MKKCFCLIMGIMTSLMSFAGDEITLRSGNPKVLYQAVSAALEIDYSSTMVKKETLDEYLKGRGEDFVRDWPEDIKKAQSYFVTRFNKKNKKGMQLVEADESVAYKMVIHISYLDMGNGGSAFNPWASAKAGGVIMNGVVDIIDLKKNKIVCSMSAEDVKGLGHVSETVRLGMCYFELASRMLKFAKSYKETGAEEEVDVQSR